MFINLCLKSKNKNSKLFFFFILKKFINFELNKNVKIISKKSLKKRFTVLKSPHVFKVAQEQFEYDLFINNIQINKLQIVKLLIILKKMKQKFCFDVSIKIKFIIDKKNYKKNLLKTDLKKNPIQKNLLFLNFYGKYFF